jgi:hypothetical protein
MHFFSFSLYDHAYTICRCYNEERLREEKDRHPSNSTDLHTLHEVGYLRI